MNGLPVGVMDPAAMQAALPTPPPPLRLPKRERRSFTINRGEVVDSVLKRLSQDLDDRSEWMDAYLRRYAKYRGWTEEKSWQFEDASHAHIPITLYTAQRLEDSLYNAVVSQRPAMQAKALQQQDLGKERRIDQLLDYEIFSLAEGERLLGDLIHNYVVDGTAHVMLRWVRGTRPIRLFERLPAPIPGSDMQTYLLLQFKRLYGEQVTILDQREHKFHLMSAEGPIDLEVFEGADGDLELVEQRDLRLDHLGLSVEDIEDIVVPSNAVNPQPPSDSNPRGAHHVFRLCTASLDTVIGRQQSGIYDLLTREDLESIRAWADQSPSGDTSRPKVQKDDLEGVDSQSPGGGHSAEGHQTVRVVEVYDRYDVDGDGLEEDVVFWVVTNAAYGEGHLARARYLTEIVPHGRHGARRPIEKFALFPVPNRYYGLSLPDLVEGMQDLMDTFFNMGADFGVLSNAPFFFYRASSGLKPEIIKLNPGEGYPLDDPRNDVYFPQLPNAQGTWISGQLALLNQFLERLTMQGQLQFGGIPQGKASAFRTTGTTQAVLQQGDTRIERVLRRLFDGLSRVWDQGLGFCQRYLPPSTEYRILGVPQADEMFDRITDRKEIAGQFRFEWRATILNTNPLMQRQTAQTLVQILASPFLLQMGIVTPEEVYRAMRRFIETLEEPNPDQYLKRPPGVSSDPKMTAEQAMSSILGGRAPNSVNAMESIQEHAQKLIAFMQSEQFGMLSPQQVALFGEYLRRVMDAAQQAAQQQQMAQAAQGFQQQLGGGNGGQPGAPGNPAAGAAQANMLSPASPLEAAGGQPGV